MKRPYQITAIVCLVVALYVAYEAVQLHYYTPVGPGPGFFPLWLSLAFGLVAVRMLWQATLAEGDALPAGFFPTRAGYLRIAAILGALAATVVLLEPLGFRLTTFAFYLFLLNVQGRPQLLVSGLIAFAGSFGAYEVFAGFLGIPLPIGVLGI